MFRAARAQVVGRKNRGCEKAQRSAGVNLRTERRGRTEVLEQSRPLPRGSNGTSLGRG
jgi:hypothetical protein